MVFIAILVLTSPFWIDWLLYHSRMSIPEGCTASPNAQIVDVSVDPVGNSKTRRLKTVVFFSDGTQYITFKSHDTPGFLSTHMVVDKEVLAEIFEDAVTAHDKLCSGTRSQPAYSVTPPAEPKAPAPSVESSQKFANPKSESTEPSPTITDPSSPAPATPKLRYCKLCGAPIDPTTRKCTDCRKQYFRPPVLHKKHLAIAAGAALVCAAVVFFVSSLVFQKNAAQAQVDALNARITELESTVAEKEREIEVCMRNIDSYQVKLTRKSEEYDKLREENTMYKDLLDFYEESVAFIGDSGSMDYHRFPCPYMDAGEGIYVYSISLLEEYGYEPCSYCGG